MKAHFARIAVMLLVGVGALFASLPLGAQEATISITVAAPMA